MEIEIDMEIPNSLHLTPLLFFYFILSFFFTVHSEYSDSILPAWLPDVQLAVL